MDDLFCPWFADFAAFCGYLYRAFYLYDNHVIYAVHHTDAALERY